MKTIAERLKESRLEKGFSRAELANICDISVSAVQMYEGGFRVPRDQIKVKLADALEKSIQDLFF